MNEWIKQRNKLRIPADTVARELCLPVETVISFDSGQGRPSAKQLMILKGFNMIGDKLASKARLPFTFVDLFSGIGGFHQALKELGGQCVAACEIDPAARETYQKNHQIREDLFFEDIYDINPYDVPDHDVLCAGFPCQPFSISGHHKALQDDRSNVLFPLFDIIRASEPSAVILENVKHIKHVSEGRVFKHIIEKLEDLGYNVHPLLLNAQNFGVPQNRERWLFVAVKAAPMEIVAPNSKSKPLKEFLDPHSEEFVFLEEPFTKIVNPKIQKSGLIFCGYRNKSIRKKGVRKGTESLSRVHKQPNRIYSVEGIHPTIPSQESSGRFWIMLENGSVRKLTVGECFRIMGFPEDFVKPVSNGKLYNQIGNSVCVPMIKNIASQILTNLKREADLHESEAA